MIQIHASMCRDYYCLWLGSRCPRPSSCPYHLAICHWLFGHRHIQYMQHIVDRHTSTIASYRRGFGQHCSLSCRSRRSCIDTASHQRRWHRVGIYCCRGFVLSDDTGTLPGQTEGLALAEAKSASRTAQIASQTAAEHRSKGHHTAL